jgi:NDP-sugar pyrophosphorylase family protein
MQVVILAGGMAKRLRPLTNNIPKALIDIDGVPFIDWQLQLLSRNGITQVVVCVSYKSDLIQSHVGDGSQFGLDVIYSTEKDQPMGTGGAIKNAINNLNENFMVIYGDSYLDVNYLELAEAYVSLRKPSMMTVFKNEGAYDQSNVKFESGRIYEYSKNKNNADFEHIDYGLSFFEKKIFDSDKYGHIFDLSLVFNELIKNVDLAGYEVYNRFYEIGSFSGIQEFTKFITENHKEKQNDF